MPSRSVGRCLLLALLAGPLPLVAQNGTAPRQLSLAQAIELARQNSPTYRQSLNDADVAAANVRAAKGGLTPTVGVGGGIGYTGSGRSTFGGSFFNQSSPTVSSSYSVDANWGSTRLMRSSSGGWVSKSAASFIFTACPKNMCERSSA